jgi:hypothetical protein
MNEENSIFLYCIVYSVLTILSLFEITALNTIHGIVQQNRILLVHNGDS